jgi:hypothetical protein
METRDGCHGNNDKPLQDCTTTFIMSLIFHKLLSESALNVVKLLKMSEPEYEKI